MAKCEEREEDDLDVIDGGVEVEEEGGGSGGVWLLGGFVGLDKDFVAILVMGFFCVCV